MKMKNIIIITLVSILFVTSLFAAMAKITKESTQAFIKKLEEGQREKEKELVSLKESALKLELAEEKPSVKELFAEPDSSRWEKIEFAQKEEIKEPITPDKERRDTAKGPLLYEIKEGASAKAIKEKETKVEEYSWEEEAESEEEVTEEALEEETEKLEKVDAAAIEGKILREKTDKPVKDADIKLNISGKPFTYKTKEDGAYSFSDLAEGEARLTVTTDDGAQSQKATLVLKKGEVQRKDFYFPSGTTILGNVIYIESEAPANNIPVKLTYRYKGKDVVKIFITDDDGAFEAAGIFTIGDCLIEINKEGYFPVSKKIYLAGLDQTYTVQIVLKPFIAFRGLVLDKDNLPVIGARVEVFIPKEGPFLQYEEPKITASSEDGTFSIADLKPVTNAKVVISHPDYWTLAKNDVEIPIGEEEVVFILNKGIEVFGIVKDVLERPVVGAEVGIKEYKPNLSLQERLAQTVIKAATDSQGAYKFDNVSLGEKGISVKKDGFQQQEAQINITQDLENLQKDFTLIGELMVEGRVLNKDGGVIPGVTLNLYGPANASTVSDSEGRYRFGNLTPDQVSITALHQDYIPLSIQRISPPGSGVDFTLTKKAASGTVSGHIEVIGDADVMPSIELQVFIKTDTGVLMYPSALQEDIGANGDFSISGLADGKYVLEARAWGYAASYSGVFEVKEGCGPEDIYIELTKPGWIEGVVLDAETQLPIKDAEVIAEGGFSIAEQVRSLLSDYSEQRTDDAGRFIIRNLAEGTYSLKATHPNYNTAVVSSISVAQDTATTGVVIQLEKTPTPPL